MKISIVTFYAMLTLPQIGWSQTLCLKDEVDYFSCQVAGSKKIISVCGYIDHGENKGVDKGKTKNEINDNSWLQYRFGKMGTIELVYPREKRGSVSKFEGNFFGKYSVSELRFINGKVLYGVEISGGSIGDDGKEIPGSGGVSVEMGKGKRANIQCQRGETDRYYSDFMELNARLRALNGETDFLSQFLNSVAKQPEGKSSAK